MMRLSSALSVTLLIGYIGVVASARTCFVEVEGADCGESTVWG